jgi:hypothetical protein
LWFSGGTARDPYSEFVIIKVLRHAPVQVLSSNLNSLKAEIVPYLFIGFLKVEHKWMGCISIP